MKMNNEELFISIKHIILQTKYYKLKDTGYIYNHFDHDGR